MAFTTVIAGAVGQRLKASLFNLLVAAIAELQTEATKPVYSSTRVGLNQANGVNVGYTGNWAAVGGYSTSGAGVTVPKTGAYLILVQTQRTAGVWNTRATSDIFVNGATLIARLPITPGTGEDNATVVGWTVLNATDVVSPFYFQASGAACTVNVTFTIIYLGAR